MTDWLLLRSGLCAASWNMALDEALLEGVGHLGRPVLRFYGWSEPAASFGYFQKYVEVSSWTPLRPLVRRPTGGGLVPHDIDWTYSLVFPPAHPWYLLRAEESYRQAHQWVADSLKALRLHAELSGCCAKPMPGRCFIGAEKFDVLSNGQKVAGAAQKRNKFGLLIQGSVQPPDHSPNRADWEDAMIQTGQSQFSVTWQDLRIDDELSARATVLQQEKYGQTNYNQHR